jgi:hypothetical protein
MAKTFADSVKLPTLVTSVEHPLLRLGSRTKSELNIEGRNRYDEHRENLFKSAERKALISSLLGDGGNSSARNSQNNAFVDPERVRTIFFFNHLR